MRIQLVLVRNTNRPDRLFGVITTNKNLKITPTPKKVAETRLLSWFYGVLLKDQEIGTPSLVLATREVDIAENEINFVFPKRSGSNQVFVFPPGQEKLLWAALNIGHDMAVASFTH
jgi:hypothetical protein